uniref:Uncharacterized protein n=1 Tax=Spironucleus salmonicida TaxID=348837 RepID=V6LVS6_9EUKA|eukprot:EST47811.1 Hypothetical protein SS50377_12211 [Spironucleus salmonicida]
MNICIFHLKNLLFVFIIQSLAKQKFIQIVILLECHILDLNIFLKNYLHVLPRHELLPTRQILPNTTSYHSHLSLQTLVWWIIQGVELQFHENYFNARFPDMQIHRHASCQMNCISFNIYTCIGYTLSQLWFAPPMVSFTVIACSASSDPAGLHDCSWELSVYLRRYGLISNHQVDFAKIVKLRCAINTNNYNIIVSIHKIMIYVLQIQNIVILVYRALKYQMCLLCRFIISRWIFVHVKFLIKFSQIKCRNSILQRILMKNSVTFFIRWEFIKQVI